MSQKKAAIARLLSDFIKADNIIEKGEIDFLSELSDEFKIKIEDKQDAENMQFTEAIEVLSELKPIERKEILDGLRRLTVADGKCVGQEALLMLAVEYCLSGEKSHRQRVSLLRSDSLEVGYGRAKMIYVETEWNQELNDEIQNNLRNINNELNMIGMDFIYVPQVKDDFAKMNESYLKNVISYLSPKVTNEKREAIYHSLCGITTERFCRDLLAGKLGMKELYGVKPSLLITLGDSSMPETQEDGSVWHKMYTQYMCIALEHDVMTTIRKFADDYKAYVESLATSTVAPNANRIMYYGFHRLLLDLHLYSGKKQDCTLLIDMANGKVKFRELDDEIELTRKIKAIYLTALQQTLCMPSKSMKDNEAALKAFRKIYSELGSDKADEATCRDDLTVALSKVRKELSENHAMVQNIEAFMPARAKSSVSVNVDADMVWIKINGKEMRLVESAWRHFGK